MLGFTRGVEGREQTAPDGGTVKVTLIGSVELSVTMSHEEKESIVVRRSMGTKKHVE